MKQHKIYGLTNYYEFKPLKDEMVSVDLYEMSDNGWTLVDEAKYSVSEARALYKELINDYGFRKDSQVGTINNALDVVRGLF